MILTHKQEEGLKIAIERYRNKDPYTVIAGYAGTGKSTLIRFIISALELTEKQVAYIAYTGKAAQVLRSKGCAGAMTAHRFLYKSVQKNDGTFVHIPKDHLNMPKGSIVVVDEVSMLPKVMWKLLLKHKVYVIACGDPAQLPAIGEATDVLNQPHIFLDEIMRQAQESEIIRLTMDIRAGNHIKPFKGKEVNIVNIKELSSGMYTWADQIICAKNATRRELNNFFRKMLWQDSNLTSDPIVGDKIICLKNNWDKVNGVGDALVNGTIGKISNISTNPNIFLDTECRIDFEAELPENEAYEVGDPMFKNLLIDWKLITIGKPTLNRDNFCDFPRILRPNEFDYGYAITCWKAQGSEYDKVLFIAEQAKFMDTDTYRRFLYTGATRASSKLTLILP